MKTLFQLFFFIVLVTIGLTGCNGEIPNIPFLNSPTPTITNTPTPTSTSTPTLTPTFTPTPTITPTPTQIGGGSGKVLFTYAKVGFESVYPDLGGEKNVFISDVDGSNLIPVTKGLRGFNYIEAVSPDGSKVLISSFRSRTRSKDANAILYLFDLNSIDKEPIKIVQGFAQHTYSPAAAWTDDLRIIYVGKGEKGYGIYVVNADGSNPQKIDTTTATPERMVGIDDERVYWSNGVYKDYRTTGGNFNVVWWTNIDGSGQGKLESNGVQIEYFYERMSFSLDRSKIAWIPSAPEPACDTREKSDELLFSQGQFSRAEKCHLLYVAEISNLDNPIKIPLTPSRYPEVEVFYYGKDYIVTWLPDNSTVLLMGSGMSFIKNRWKRGETVLYSVADNHPSSEIIWLEKFPSLNDSNDGWHPSIYGFSPDEKQIIVRKIIDGSKGKVILVDLESMSLEDNFLNKLNLDEIRDVYLLP
jgi:hypothetical protein